MRVYILVKSYKNEPRNAILGIFSSTDKGYDALCYQLKSHPSGTIAVIPFVDDEDGSDGFLAETTYYTLVSQSWEVDA